MANLEKTTPAVVTDQYVESSIEEDAEYTYREQRKIIHKVDRRLLIVLGAIQAVSFLDRANISNANIAGMSKDLMLSIDNRYSLALLVFFGPFVILQFPASIVLRKVGPRLFMSVSVFAWGIVMIGFGFVQTWTSLIPLRMLVGAFESGTLSGEYLLISLWYSRYDLHKRVSSFYLVAQLGNAFGGVLGLLFSQMKTLGGLAPWRWIFVMEGIITCIIGVLAYVFTLDFPENAHKAWRFLSVKETDFIVRRINRDRADVDVPKFDFGNFMKAGLDFKLWIFGLCYFCATIQAYAVGFFLPLILQGEMGFSVASAQTLSSPPYLFAMALMFVEGWICDKIRLRGPCLVFNAVLGSIGLCLMTWTKTAGSQYVGAILVTACCQANIPALMAYQSNNIRGPWKRTFSSASLVTFGGIGGIAGSLVFRAQDAPKYIPGITACLAANGATVLIVALLTFYFYISNRRATRGEMLIEDLPGFRFTY